MHAFLEWFEHNHEIDPVLKSGIAHLWFVTIHPFDDGNGRIARAIADMALARSEQVAERFYSMSAQIRTERKAYYDILERTQKRTMDITPWFRVVSGMLRARDRWSTNHTGSRSSQSSVLEFSSETTDQQSPKYSSRPFARRLRGQAYIIEWAKLAKCSQDTAHRDINDLVERGILKKDHAGGRSTSYSIADEFSTSGN